MPVVVDDLLLLRCLAEQPPQAIAADLAGGDVFTTSYWWFRLGRAIVRGSGTAALSGQMARLDPEIRHLVRHRLHVLPPFIGLVPARFAVPLMFNLPVRQQPNVLAAEALAAALAVYGRLAVTADDPLIRDGAADLELDYELVPRAWP